jgi:hypothetical protein
MADVLHNETAELLVDGLMFFIFELPRLLLALLFWNQIFERPHNNKINNL